MPRNSGNFDVANFHDIRERARRRLPRFLFEYVDRGAEDELSLAANRAAFERVKLRHRVMIDVSRREHKISLFGGDMAMPVAIAPTGSAAMMWYRGELQLARAAKAAGIPFTVGGGSSLPIEEAVAQGGRIWFQLYVWDDLALSHKVIDRVNAAGAEVLIITADSAMPPIREYNARNGFSSPFRITPRNALDVMRHPAWALKVVLPYWTSTGLPRYENVPDEMKVTVAERSRQMKISASYNWDDFDAMRRRWPRTLLVKGVMTAEDALLAIRHKADGIVVSNHGGRNLDAAPATLDALPAIVQAVDGRVPVIMDGGVRRGSDVVKALALGARAVLMGRPTLYGVAMAGEAGARRALAILKNEIDTTLGFIGCPRMADVDGSVIHR
jgi:isopentenyl diphosphate isomerase/L-lactate dehydrogenase-like FMN-dependent dehydrogenase